MNCRNCKVEITSSNSYQPAKGICKSCFNKYCIDRWKDRKAKAIQYKGGKCELCGYSKYYGALEFHHTDPSSKEASWNKIRLWSWGKIKSELDKCELLCSNCHREVHGDDYA